MLELLGCLITTDSKGLFPPLYLICFNALQCQLAGNGPYYTLIIAKYFFFLDQCRLAITSCLNENQFVSFKVNCKSGTPASCERREQFLKDLALDLFSLFVILWLQFSSILFKTIEMGFGGILG